MIPTGMHLLMCSVTRVQQCALLCCYLYSANNVRVYMSMQLALDTTTSTTSFINQHLGNNHTFILTKQTIIEENARHTHCVSRHALCIKRRQDELEYRGGIKGDKIEMEPLQGSERLATEMSLHKPYIYHLIGVVGYTLRAIGDRVSELCQVETNNIVTIGGLDNSTCYSVSICDCSSSCHPS